MAADQFLNADITFKEIETIKKIFKQKNQLGLQLQTLI